MYWNLFQFFNSLNLWKTFDWFVSLCLSKALLILLGKWTSWPYSRAICHKMATTIATASFPKNVPSKFFLASLVQDSVAATIIPFNSAFFDAKKYDHIYLKFPPFIGQVFFPYQSVQNSAQQSSFICRKWGYNQSSLIPKQSSDTFTKYTTLGGLVFWESGNYKILKLGGHFGLK